MQQEDWVGGLKNRPFKDIRNQRDSTAEQKAQLSLVLGDLCTKIPAVIKNGGTVQDVRHMGQRYAFRKALDNEGHR